LEILSAFILGLAGSLHCIGMCGPILLALPGGKISVKLFTGRLIYNLGRVFTYSIFGLIFGLLGKGFMLFGFQRWVSISVGILIIIYLILPSGFKNKLTGTSPIISFNRRLKTIFGKLLKKNSLSSMLGIGIINGFLPCGFVYMAIGGSVTMGDALQGMIFMMLFGLGTIPIMLTSSLILDFISLNIRQNIRKVLPALAFLLAVIFILRGLNLGIPFISPKMKSVDSIEMHH